MIDRMQLVRLVLEVRRPERWRRFVSDTLGLTPQDGQVVLREGRRDDVAAIGWTVTDHRARRELAARVPLEQDGDAEWFVDPEGTRHEVSLAEAQAGQPQRAAGPALGHVVLVARDLLRMERFYVDTLGFGVSERLATRVGPIDVRGVFLHCSRRHHSLALLALPQRKKLHHFMLELGSVTEVVRAHDRARRQGVPMSLGLGQHPEPDGTVSFYGRTPSGFDFELGAGGLEIEPRDWTPQEQTVTSSWGHQPTLGLQLRAAREMLATRLGL